MLVDSNVLLARMQPSGQYRMFNIQPGQQFIIDGKSKQLTDLTPGTFLTATATTTTQPITVRTTTVTNGTVWYVQGNYVVLSLENGETREYTVPDSFTFTSEGKPATVKDLRKGMRVSATKIVAEPTAQISKEIVITRYRSQIRVRRTQRPAAFVRSSRCSHRDRRRHSRARSRVHR